MKTKNTTAVTCATAETKKADTPDTGTIGGPPQETAKPSRGMMYGRIITKLLNSPGFWTVLFPSETNADFVGDDDSPAKEELQEAIRRHTLLSMRRYDLYYLKLENHSDVLGFLDFYYPEFMDDLNESERRDVAKAFSSNIDKNRALSVANQMLR